MFDLPNSKRVKRQELYSRSPSTEPSDLDPDLQARFLSRLSNIHKNENGEPLIAQAEDAPNPTGDRNGKHLEEEEEEEAYEFRLFSAPTSKSSDPQTPHTAPQRIVLRSPTPTSGDPGFINPRRSDTYYFTGAPSPEKSEQYRTAAITAEEIFKGLAVRWRGAELPWRVTILNSPHSPHPLNRSKFTTQPTDTATTLPSKRKRSGKKRRIAIRTKRAAKSAKELAKKQSLAEKEAAEREKRTRRNREKKVKRKEKEKAKKALGVDP